MPTKELIDGGYIKEAALVLVTADADLTQVITVTTAGTPVQGPNVTNPGGWVIKASPANTGTGYFMFHGQTKAAKGFPLAAGDPYPLMVANLSDIDFDVDTSGDKFHASKF